MQHSKRPSTDSSVSNTSNEATIQRIHTMCDIAGVPRKFENITLTVDNRVFMLIRTCYGNTFDDAIIKETIDVEAKPTAKE